MVIGIEGLVGAGKTSICRELLNIIPNAVLLHGGNLYRAIVYALLQEEKNILKLISKNLDLSKEYFDILSALRRLEKIADRAVSMANLFHFAQVGGDIVQS